MAAHAFSARGSQSRSAALPRPYRCAAEDDNHQGVQGDRDAALLAARAGLRRRRGSLHYKRTGSLAEVAELLGDSKRVAADHHVYALTDYREVDRTIAFPASRAARPYGTGCASTVTFTSAISFGARLAYTVTSNLAVRPGGKSAGSKPLAPPITFPARLKKTTCTGAIDESGKSRVF